MAKLDEIKAYELIKEEKLPDVDGVGYYLKHRKTGAKIVLVKNSDDNKTFAIGFRTPPTDSTGVAHIIEHSVLCGSEKFPAKDPFVELCKGSLNTFLNALTFADKTCYPVASCNMQDLKNLMDVYMDAVLHPNIYKVKEIFKQEGWHYELESKDADLIYNGVVYNEMKGAFSSPEGVLYRQSMNSLFPDTQYGVESGGDPEAIPDLTYEAFLDFHSRYYHPSNSYIYLYGDMDFEERLEWLDKEYLSKYDALNIDSSLKKQKPFGKMIDKAYEYSVEASDKDNQTFYAYNVLAGNNMDLKESIALEVLDRVLVSNNGAPVKLALREAGIGEDYFASYSSDVLQPYYMIAAKNAKKGELENFKKTITAAFEKVVKEGINEKSLKAVLNVQEFRYKEADFGGYPKGLIYGLNILGTWLYNDENPFISMHANKVYKELKNEIGTGYFEGIVKKFFLNSEHGTWLTLKPVVGLSTKKEQECKEKLAKIKASLSESEIEKLVEDTKNLKKYQGEQSSKEDLEKIPLLSISDIDKKSKPYLNEECKAGDLKFVWQDYFTNGIDYLMFYFRIKHLSADEVPYLHLLTSLLGNIDTKKRTYSDLSDELDIYTGGTSVDIIQIMNENVHGEFTPCVATTVKTLPENLEKSLDLMKEILTQSVFTNKKRILERILEMKSRYEAGIVQAGHSYAIRRAASYLNESAVYSERTGGIASYLFIKDIAEHFDEKYDSLVDKFEDLSRRVFTKENLVIGITSSKEDKDDFGKKIGAFANDLFENVKSDKELHFDVVNRREGFKTPGQVQYVVRCGNMHDAGIEYHGSFNALCNILNYGYLWNEVRVKGGAYGCGFYADGLSGNILSYSYRDPNLVETNNVYEKMVDYVENFNADDREMTKYIIGAISNIDFPLTPRTKGMRSFTAYLQNTDIKRVQKYRDELLATTVEDIRNAKKLIEALLSKNAICVVGSASKIESNKELFGEVCDIFA